MYVVLCAFQIKLQMYNMSNSEVAQSVDPLAMQETTCSTGDRGSIPGSGRSPGKGSGNPLQYCGPENPVDRGAWRAPAWSSKSRTQLSS